MHIAASEDIAVERKRILCASVTTIDSLRKLLKTSRPIDALYAMKFELTGHHPLGQHGLNLIEQLNQTFTILTTLAAAEKLLLYGKPLTLHLGNRTGPDIISNDKTIVAEVFASVDPANNKKLEDDLTRVAKHSAEQKYVFYYTPSDRGVSRLEAQHPSVRLQRITKEEMMGLTSAATRCSCRRGNSARDTDGSTPPRLRGEIPRAYALG